MSMFCAALFLSTYFLLYIFSLFFFFNDTATTEIYTLSLHDALPISDIFEAGNFPFGLEMRKQVGVKACTYFRSEEHTSELQSLRHLVCRLLLEKKKIRAEVGDLRTQIAPIDQSPAAVT